MENCVIWLGARSKGYGQKKVHGRVKYVHRLSYEAERGPIPVGLQIDHLCREPLCFNVEHLRAVTPRVNSLASRGLGAINAAKTHCPRGHALIGHNLRPAHLARGQRACRECYKAAKRRARRMETAP